MGYVDEKPFPAFPFYWHTRVRDRYPPPTRNIRDKLRTYAWVATYYDNLKLTKTIESVCKDFKPLPKQDEAESSDGNTKTQLPGYTLEGAVAAEIYCQLFGQLPPLPEIGSFSPAQDAGQVYNRDPVTFMKDFRPQLSDPANPATVELLRQQIPQIMEQRIFKALRGRKKGEEQVAKLTRSLIRYIPTDYLDALSISNGIYGVGCERSAMLDSAEDILADPEEATPAAIARYHTIDSSKGMPGDHIFGKDFSGIVTGFKIASSPTSSSWYVVVPAWRDYEWRLIRVPGLVFWQSYDFVHDINVWTRKIRAKIEHDSGCTEGYFCNGSYPPDGRL